jgi:transposase
MTKRELRAKRVKTVKEGTLIATVDIGLASNTGYWTAMDGRSTKSFRFANSKEGFEKFWGMAIASKNRFGCDEVLVGYESTGPYAEPLVHYLANKPVKMVQVNPMHTKKMKEVNDNSHLKTDDKDPLLLDNL